MANRFWVGGSGNWSDTAHWSTSIGGVGGASVPGSSDVAYVNSSSGSAGYTITLTSSAVVYQLYMTPNSMTFDLQATLTIGQSSGFSGVLSADSNVAWTGTGSLAPNGAGASFSIFNSVPNVFSSGSPNGTLSLSAPLTVSGQVSWSSGAIAFGANNLTCDNFYSAGSTQVSFSKSSGGGTIYLTGTNKTVWNTTGATNISSSAGYVNVVLSTASSSGYRRVQNTSIAFSFSVSAGSDLLTFTDSGTGAASVFNLSLTGFTGTLDVYGITIYGTSVTLPSGITYSSASGNLTLSPSTAPCTVTTGGQAINRNVVITTTYSVLLASNFSTGNSNNVNLGSGTLYLQGYTLTAQNFTMSVFTKIEYASGVISLSGNWVGSGSGGIYSSGTAGTIRMTSGSAKSFTGNGFAYANVTLENAGNGNLTITGSNSFEGISYSSSAPVFLFQAGSTQTVTNFNVSGVLPIRPYLGSASPGSQWYFRTAGTTVRLSYVTIQDSNAVTTGGKTYYLENVTNQGNNTNWNFVNLGGFIAFF